MRTWLQRLFAAFFETDTRFAGGLLALASVLYAAWNAAGMGQSTIGVIHGYSDVMPLPLWWALFMSFGLLKLCAIAGGHPRAQVLAALALAILWMASAALAAEYRSIGAPLFFVLGLTGLLIYARQSLRKRVG